VQCKAQCTPYNQDDGDSEGCEGWCKVASSHCTRRARVKPVRPPFLHSSAHKRSTRKTAHAGPYCKCKGCDLCAGRCLPWCSTKADCGSDACKGCELCAENSQCEPWCLEQHCGQGACAGCAACIALGERVACDSGLVNDVGYEMCSSWCKESFKTEHCSHCACRGCLYCEPTLAFDSGRECAPFNSEDSHTMRCEGFCSEELFDLHCDLCKCKACDFCPTRLETSIPCRPLSADDSSTVKCELFCAPQHASAHCALCKCGGCAFCFDSAGSATAPGGTGAELPPVSDSLSEAAQAHVLKTIQQARLSLGEPDAAARPPAEPDGSSRGESSRPKEMKGAGSAAATGGAAAARVERQEPREPLETASALAPRSDEGKASESARGLPKSSWEHQPGGGRDIEGGAGGCVGAVYILIRRG
jgi:hypothetical protein